ncbi:hypothetical protein D0T51_08020 [Parabacteroides sp. 52]|uniref:hypothetical protein n=1 Tax=unclassified Parabacteroides TaxID=2649774 RepID=UPI0013D2E6DC|nr:MULTISPECIES: hypothetical protein [unclassified Parabacteroides]MDH6534950.1 hypothetical protein [Parabacteroides sp. PM5-20]NDV55671.1 hypothetical protein [Parabacteroides sp. 52]
MAKRKTLKRDIGYAAGELFTEVLVTKMLIPGVNQEKADALMTQILDMQDTFIRRAGKPDAKENKKLIKEYYKKLFADLQKDIDLIVKGVEELGKESNA